MKKSLLFFLFIFILTMISYSQKTNFFYPKTAVAYNYSSEPTQVQIQKVTQKNKKQVSSKYFFGANDKDVSACALI